VVALSTLLGCVGVVGDPSSETPGWEPVDRPPPPFSPGPSVLPRLTAVQYENVVRDLFGAPVPEVVLEADQNPHLFYNIGASTTTLSGHGTSNYVDAADAITLSLFDGGPRQSALLGCVPESASDACIRGFVAATGRRVFRRPLTSEERARWESVAEQTADGDPIRGARLALFGMLQSPHFLYRTGAGEPDPENPSRRRYTSIEMATRLSFLFWNTTPDEALLAAAERGELVDDADLFEHAMRLAEDPKARGAVQDFFSQYLDLGRLAGVERDPASYPEWSQTMAKSMETELRLLVDDLVFRRDGDMRELFSTRRTFVNTELAVLYGVDAPGASPIAFVPVELPQSGPRAGILSLGAFLTMNAHDSETSPTLRGKYVRERVLCEVVPAPPDDVNLDLTPDGGDARTLRERLEEHRANPECASCHSFIDPPGFLFERFDSIGRFRTEVEGEPLDTTGELDGVPLADARGLADALADDARVPSCVVRQLYRHASGRLELASEEAALVALDEAFADSGYRFRDLMVALAMSEGFRTVNEGGGSE
jgi:hypothetical protein